MVLWCSSSFVQPLLLLLLCLVSLLGLSTWNFAFIHSLPMWFVTFPEGLFLLASLWLPGGTSLDSGDQQSRLSPFQSCVLWGGNL